MRELIVDSFAGGGGASLGIALATGHHPDVAINHEPAAIAMHAANHPRTRHYTEDVFHVSPQGGDLLARRPGHRGELAPQGRPQDAGGPTC